AGRFVAEEILPRLYAPAMQRLQSHLRRGDTVVLLSGTLEPIARALADALAVPHVRATLCRERGGRYLAGPPDVHPFGATKHDLDLLQAVGDPVAVMPDPPLLETARGNRWHIIRSRKVPHVLPQ